MKILKVLLVVVLNIIASGTTYYLIKDYFFEKIEDNPGALPMAVVISIVILAASFTGYGIIFTILIM